MEAVSAKINERGDATYRSGRDGGSTRPVRCQIYTRSTRVVDGA